MADEKINNGGHYNLQIKNFIESTKNCSFLHYFSWYVEFYIIHREITSKTFTLRFCFVDI